MLDVNRMVDAVLSAVGAPILALAKRVAALEERAPKDGAEGQRGDPGPAGEMGPAGAEGPPGAAGKDGNPVTRDQILEAIAADPSIIAAAVAGYLAENPPAAGKDGADGIDGKDGAPGERGEIGPIGERGAEGAVGYAGLDGKDGIPGAVGAPGEKGLDGKDGVGLAGALIGRDGELAVTLTDGRVVSLGAVVGRDGAPGSSSAASAEMSLAPDDVAEQVAKAMKLVAESPTVAAKGSAVVLNINSAQKSTKTITTRRDKDGNLVADVVENRG